MGIFYKSETRSNNYVDTNNFDAFPSGSVPLSALNWDERRALMSSDIFTAVTTLAKDISKLDIRVQENGVYRERDYIEHLINKKPNKIYNGTQLKFIVMMSALLNGKGYIMIERNPMGHVQELHHVQTSRVQLKEDRNDKFYYEIGNNGKTMLVPFEDIITIMPYSTDGVNAITALGSLQDDINNQQFGKKFFTNFFANGSNAGSVLKMKDGKLSNEARNKIKQKWIEANSGSDKINSVIVLDETMEFEQLEINTDILDIINKNTASTRAIAKAFGLPLSKLGVEQTNTSLQDALDDYLMNTLGSYMKVWTSELDFKLIQDKDKYTKQFVFDTTAFRTVNWQQHVDILNTQLEKGGVTLDEYRKGLGLPPIPDGLGASHRVDLNHIDLKLADDFQLREVSTNNQTTKAVSEDATKPTQEPAAEPTDNATVKGGEIDE